MSRCASTKDEAGLHRAMALQQGDALAALLRPAREEIAVQPDLVRDAGRFVDDDAGTGVPAGAMARAGPALGTGQPLPALVTCRADELALVEGLLGQADAEGAVAQPQCQPAVGDRLAAGHAVPGVAGVAGAELMRVARPARGHRADQLPDGQRHRGRIAIAAQAKVPAAKGGEVLARAEGRVGPTPVGLPDGQWGVADVDVAGAQGAAPVR